MICWTAGSENHRYGSNLITTWTQSFIFSRHFFSFLWFILMPSIWTLNFPGHRLGVKRESQYCSLNYISLILPLHCSSSNRKPLVASFGHCRCPKGGKSCQCPPEILLVVWAWGPTPVYAAGASAPWSLGHWKAESTAQMFPTGYWVTRSSCKMLFPCSPLLLGLRLKFMGIRAYGGRNTLLYPEWLLSFRRLVFQLNLCLLTLLLIFSALFVSLFNFRKVFDSSVSRSLSNTPFTITSPPGMWKI